jgi:hypothetical protein
MNTRIAVDLRHLALYPTNCYCEVCDDGRGMTFQLIALFMNGLRLKATNGEDLATLRLGQELNANIKITSKGLESGAFPCRVRSLLGDEIFLRFGAPLSFPFLATIRDNPQYFPW